jgi:hypothetical protein
LRKAGAFLSHSCPSSGYAAKMKNKMSDYDYQSYEKCLEKILESTQKDYWAQYIDINRHQVIVGRTYL